MGLSLALVHFPTVNKKGRAVATSVTNFDIHDIARAAKTFGVERFFLVTPIGMQHDFIRRVIRYWVEEEGADYNPTRREALEGIEIARDLAEVGSAIARETGVEPFWIATSARAEGPLMKTSEVRSRLENGEELCLIFGTGYGLHPELLELVDATLEPIQGPTPYNHLSVRSAVSIYLDRILGVGRQGP